jgi:hypothetical protein
VTRETRKFACKFIEHRKTKGRLIWEDKVQTEKRTRFLLKNIYSVTSCAFIFLIFKQERKEADLRNNAGRIVRPAKASSEPSEHKYQKTISGRV